MKRYISLFVTLLFLSISTKAQDGGERIQKLGAKLDSLETVIPALSKPVDLSINSTKLPTFLRLIASSHSLNISIDPNLKDIDVTQSFKNAKVKDVLLNLSKEKALTIDAIGNILSIKKYIPPYIKREIPVYYNSTKDLLTADIQQDSLSLVARKITLKTGKNISFDVGLGNNRVTSFIKDMSLDAAIEKLVLENKLKVTKQGEVYLIEDPTKEALIARRGKSGGFYFKIKDTINQIVAVDFKDVPVENVINDIAYDLKVNMATSTPLKGIGKATMKSDSISFNNLLTRLLDDTKFSYKLEHGMYFFGKKKLASLQNAELIVLENRSIERMMEPLESSTGFLNNQQIPNSFSQNGNYSTGAQGQSLQSARNRSGISSSVDKKAKTSDEESLKSIFPEELTDSLTVKIDTEQNGFVVMGDAQRIEKFKKFVKQIDNPITEVLIEVMIVEVSNSTSVSAGIDLGIGDAPVQDKGTLFSGTDLTLGAKTINRVIGGLDGFGSLNIGKVVPNFYARIQALETNGDLKIKSTPKLTALNGHIASFINGQRTYYTQTLVNTIGNLNPQTQEFVNYVPIDANLSIKIRPFVSGNGDITLSIDVQQSSFNSTAVPEGAPPGIDTRKLTSTVRVKNQDVVILGGMEVDSKSNSGSGVPFLARIPVIKWLFSKRVRTARKSKLSVLIKPTILKSSFTRANEK